MFEYHCNINCENQRYVQKIDNPNIYLAKSCICEVLTKSKYPLFLRYNVIIAIIEIAVTKNEANTYQPNKVEYQCVSIDMIQSQDIIDSVMIKNTKYTAASLKFFL